VYLRFSGEGSVDELASAVVFPPLVDWYGVVLLLLLLLPRGAGRRLKRADRS